MPLNQQAFRDGSLGILGSLPPVHARRDGVLGALPPAGSVKSGILGVLGAPPVAGSYHSGVLGAAPAGRGAPPVRFAPMPPPVHSIRAGVLGEYFAQDGLGADAASAPILVALAGLGVVATGWYFLSSRRRRRA